MWYVIFRTSGGDMQSSRCSGSRQMLNIGIIIIPFDARFPPSMYLTWSPSVQCRLHPSPFHLSLFDFQRSRSWIVRSSLDWRPRPLKIERILKRLYYFWWEESDFKACLHFVLPFHWNLTWSWKMAVLRDQETRRSSEGTSLVLKSDWCE